MHKHKIDLAKVMAALNNVCPKCGYSISPALMMRIDFDRIFTDTQVQNTAPFYSDLAVHEPRKI